MPSIETSRNAMHTGDPVIVFTRHMARLVTKKLIKEPAGLHPTLLVWFHLLDMMWLYQHILSKVGTTQIIEKGKYEWSTIQNKQHPLDNLVMVVNHKVCDMSDLTLANSPSLVYNPCYIVLMAYTFVHTDSTLAAEVSQRCKIGMKVNKNMGNNHFFVKVDLITNSNLSISNSQKEKYKVWLKTL